MKYRKELQANDIKSAGDGVMLKYHIQRFVLQQNDIHQNINHVSMFLATTRSISAE